MKVLFVGGTGVISTAVSRLAVERGMELHLLNRGRRGDSFPEGARRIVADKGDRAAVKAALRGERYDAVVDWIAYTSDDAAADIELFSGMAEQYVFISSASAYQKPPSYYVITESTPLANPFWQYSRDKIACEELLMRAYRERGFPVTIVRPSHTYGPGQIPAALTSWSHPWTLVDRMRRGREVVVPGDGSSLWTLTHNSDFAKGFLGLLGNARAIGHAFHITSDEVLTWDQIYAQIAQAAGAKLQAVHIASDFIAAASPEETGGLLGDKTHCAVFDNAKVKAFVPGYAATRGFAEGIRESIAWFEAHPERRTIDEGFNSSCDRILAAYAAGLKQIKAF